MSSDNKNEINITSIDELLATQQKQNDNQRLRKHDERQREKDQRLKARRASPLDAPPAWESPRPSGSRRRTDGDLGGDGGRMSGREWLSQHVYPTLHVALVALDRCRPHDLDSSPSTNMPGSQARSYQMSPAAFLSKCLEDRSFLEEAMHAPIDMSAEHSLLTFLEGGAHPKYSTGELPRAYCVDKILSDAVRNLAKERPQEPLAVLAKILEGA